MKIVSRFSELYNALSKTLLKRRAKKIIRREAQVVLNDIFETIMSRLPEGQPEPIDMAGTIGNKPSIRIWGIDLAHTFLNSVGDVTVVKDERTPDGVGLSLRIGVDHPSYERYDYGIVEFLEYGTELHIEPDGNFDNDRYVAFWWGSPLRWPYKDGLGPGMRIFGHVEHPGATPSPFLDASIKAHSTQMRMMFETLHKWIVDAELDRTTVLERTR